MSTVFHSTSYEIYLQVALKDVGVDLSYTIHGMRSNDGEISHVDTFFSFLLNHGHTTKAISVSRESLGYTLGSKRNTVKA
jgi:hypothetical protein